MNKPTRFQGIQFKVPEETDLYEPIKKLKNVHDIRKEVKEIKEKLSDLVNKDEYDKIINISNNKKLDDSLMEALEDLETALANIALANIEK